MVTKTEDVCVVRGFSLTENKILHNMKLLKTYFNIRDNKGAAFGPDYDDIEKPLAVILNIDIGNAQHAYSEYKLFAHERNGSRNQVLFERLLEQNKI